MSGRGYGGRGRGRGRGRGGGRGGGGGGRGRGVPPVRRRTMMEDPWRDPGEDSVGTTPVGVAMMGSAAVAAMALIAYKRFRKNVHKKRGGTEITPTTTTTTTTAQTETPFLSNEA